MSADTPNPSSKKYDVEMLENASQIKVMEEDIKSDGLFVFEGLSEEETKQLEKRLVRKIDLHLVLVLFALFIFNILDRSNIASARLGGLEKDLHLTGTQYQTTVSILFAGYLIGQIPSNILLTRLRPSIYMPIAIIIWGGISTASAGTHSFGGIMAVRVLLGFAESPFFPAAVFLISSWYKPAEIAPRVAVMYCGNTVANGFGGLLAAGILKINGGGLEPWRWLFIIEGVSTIIVGFVAFFLLPDFPDTKKPKWLTEQEQRFAIWRLAVAINGETDEIGTIKDAIKDALTDPKVYLLVLVQNCLLSSQTWTYFFPTIVQTLGYSSTISLLLTAPVYIFGFCTSLGNSIIAMKSGKRAILIIWPLTLDIVGNVMVISSHKTAVRYTGMFFMCAGSYSAFNVVQAWIGSTVPRTRTKRAFTYALVNVFGNLSNVYGSYFFPSSDGPQYIHAGITLSSFAAGGCCFAAILGLYLRYLNKKITAAEARDGVTRYKFMY